MQRKKKPEVKGNSAKYYEMKFFLKLRISFRKLIKHLTISILKFQLSLIIT